MLSAATLSQHAVGQSEAREVRHAIPACNNIHKLSQHEVAKSEPSKVRHAIPACDRDYPSIHSAGMLSQHALPNLNCIKAAAKAQNSRQVYTTK